MRKFFRRAGIIFTAYAMLFTGLFIHMPAQFLQNVDAKQLASVAGEKILICTSEGYKWVSWQELGQHQQKQDSKNQKVYLKILHCFLKFLTSSLDDFEYPKH